MTLQLIKSKGFTTKEFIQWAQDQRDQFYSKCPLYKCESCERRWTKPPTTGMCPHREDLVCWIKKESP